MAAKVPSNTESLAFHQAGEQPVTDDSVRTAPYGNDVNEEKHSHAHVTYLHKLVHEDPIHRPYRIAAIVATGIALLTSIGSVITAGIMWQKAYDYKGTDANRVLYAALYIFVLTESCLSFVAMLVDFSELFFRPRNVLIRDRTNSKFVGRCITVLILMLTAIYSFVVPIVLKNHQPKVSPALCVIPGVRLVSLIVFFAVLLVDSKL